MLGVFAQARFMRDFVGLFEQPEGGGVDDKLDMHDACHSGSQRLHERVGDFCCSHATLRSRCRRILGF